MSLLRFLGIGGQGTGGDPGVGETQSVRRIAGHLERLPADSAQFLAAFACVLSRVAHADLAIEDDEIAEIKRLVHDTASLSDEEADLVVEIATSEIREFGGTEGYVVTREFRRISNHEQRLRLLQCLYTVAAADGTISTTESGEISAIGEELGFTRPEVMGIRSAWKEKLAELRKP